MAAKKNFTVTVNFFKEQYLPVVIWNKKHLSKYVVSVTCTLEKNNYLP